MTNVDCIADSCEPEVLSADSRHFTVAIQQSVNAV